MFKTVTAALLALSASAPLVSAKDVFAHVIIGNTASYSPTDWSSQIALAASSGLDGFALNIAKDAYTAQQLTAAYDAAEKHGNFKLFLSFDYAAAASQGGFAPSDVVALLKQYTTRSGQYKYNNKPLVSTFEGADNKGDWAGIKSQVDCFFMPDYSSLGPAAAASVPGVDGLFSWDAWPDGAADTPTSDAAYKSALGGKPYMKPLAPWFYTNLQSKNWLWRGDSLWHDSWAQAMTTNPDLIEVLTWNDWGESSYVAPNPANPSALPQGSAGYVTPTNHSAWLTDLPFYISKFKGGSSPTATNPHITFWHRLSPAASCASTNTPCNAPYQSTHPSAATCDTDAIFFTVFPASSSSSAQPQVTIEMGGVSKTVSVKVDGTGAAHGSIAFSEFGGKYGAVTVSATGAGGSGGKLGPVTGEPIKSDCVAGWNAFVASSA